LPQFSKRSSAPKPFRDFTQNSQHASKAPPQSFYLQHINHAIPYAVKLCVCSSWSSLKPR
jgi:hypothetical protein